MRYVTRVAVAREPTFAREMVPIAGIDVALVLASFGPGEPDGLSVLSSVRPLHPTAAAAPARMIS